MKRVAALLALLTLVGLASSAMARGRGWGRSYSLSRSKTDGGAAAVSIPAFAGGDTDVMLIVYGQSNSIGTNSGSADTTTAQFPGDVTRHTGLVDLVESAVETPASSMTNFLRSENGAGREFYNESLGVSGKDWEQLEEGGSEPTNWTSMVNKLTTTHGTVGAAECFAVAMIHGESDSWDQCNGVGCTNEYRNYLSELSDDLTSDCVDDNGQTRAVAVFASQVSSWHQPTTCYGGVVANEQVQAARSDPAVFLTHPTYHMGLGTNTVFSVDGVHYGDNGANGTRGHDLLGHYIGRAMAETFVHDRPWQPLWVSSAVASGSTIDLTYEVPCTRAGNCSGDPLVIDTSAVVEAFRTGDNANYGFTLNDPNPLPRHIESVAITPAGGNVVRLTLNDTVQSGTEVWIGQRAYCGALAGNGDRTGNVDGARVNLRDTNNQTTIDMTPSETLVNWAVQERVAVTGGATPAASVAALTEDVDWTWAYLVQDDGTDAPFPGTSCNASKDWEAMAQGEANEVGGHTMQYVSGTWTCGGSTGNAATDEIGPDSVNEGITLGGVTGGWETDNAASDLNVAHFAKGEDDDYWIRYIGETVRPAALTYLLWYGVTDPNNRLTVIFQSTGIAQVIVGTSGQNLTAASTALLPATSQFGLIDIYIADQGLNGGMTIYICVNGTCEQSTSAAEGGAIGCKTATDCGTTNPARLEMSIASAFNQSGARDDGPIVFLGAKRGPGAFDQFSQARHTADWNNLND